MKKGPFHRSPPSRSWHPRWRSAAGGRPARVAIRAARLLDVKSGRYVEHPVVVVVGGPDRERRHDASRPGRRSSTSATACSCPGSSTSHTHILLQGDATAAEYEEQILKEYPAHRVVRAVRAMQIALEHGFTTMRDLETEGAGYDDVAIRDAVDEGVVPGPRLKVVGPALSTTGSYPITHFRPDWKFPVGVMVCDGADALPQGRARAALLRHGLGQDLREHRRPAAHRRRVRGLASQLDEGGDRRRRLRGPRPRRQGGGARPLGQRRAHRRRRRASTRSSTATRSARRWRPRWRRRASPSVRR